MKYIFSFVICICFSCASYFLYAGAKLEKYGSVVEVIEYTATAEVEYENYNYMTSELKKKADMQMWAKDRYETELSKLPQGGYVLIELKGITLACADPENWEYSVQTMDGNEILRVKGKHNVPNYRTSEFGTTWWNIDGFPLTERMTTPLKIYVFSNITNKRSGFIVYPEKIGLQNNSKTR